MCCKHNLRFLFLYFSGLTGAARQSEQKKISEFFTKKERENEVVEHENSQIIKTKQKKNLQFDSLMAVIDCCCADTRFIAIVAGQRHFAPPTFNVGSIRIAVL